MKKMNQRVQRQSRKRPNTRQQKFFGILIPLKSVIPVYAISTLGTGLYSFLTTGDTRFIDFYTIIGNAPSPFSDFLSLYSEMRIRDLVITVIPIKLPSSSTGSYSSLSVTVSPEFTASSNPTNSTVLDTPSAFSFDYNAVSPKTFRYTFPGVGTGSQIWISTSANPIGSLFIGNMVTSSFDESAIVWEMHFSMNVEFRRLKTN